ncbi:inactive pancreatic lipase-related protein 1-like isoform X2 [Ostrea edulis]|uniref:inactive pancreatic lipase-related protein 1-like isoform X2 n=1 Tax=Ostrea edulis TaxID=37623 RepID=UPI0020964901|nr:inactive pancreatic lipase-related protein 1-like isoform X2 [Ostrea edulis]
MAPVSILVFLGLIFVSYICAVDAETHQRQVVCYPRLGCFSIQPPLNNTDVLPMNPSYIDTKFHLFTDYHERTPKTISENDLNSHKRTGFRPDLDTVFIIHGFLQNGRVEWMVHMAMELLRKKPQNVILVDWGNGSGFPYNQATANTRVVGEEIAALITSLNRMFGTTNSKYHLIGHSLGAHIAGYAGSRLPELGRITGLDPAQPNFANFDIQIRLDQSDAVFVDAIHTDGSDYDTISGYGMMLPVGHMDFYPNGGSNQPGCPRQSFMNIITEEYEDGTSRTGNIISCSHSRSISLFMESINTPCPFASFQCSRTRDFLAGNCFDCGGLPCPTIGYNAIKYRARGKFYLATRSSVPFCGHQYLIRLELGNFNQPLYGTLRLKFLTTSGISDWIIFSGLNRPFISGQTRSAMLVELSKLGGIQQAQLEFREQSSYFSWSYNRGIVIRKITITTAETDKSVYFCGDQLRMTSRRPAGLHRPQYTSDC